PRERILTKAEEEKLLAACTGWNKHLRPIIICALDTGMRRGEIFKLTWADVDFESGMINIKAFNTKTLRERQVAMTSRLSQELYALWHNSRRDPDELVFGITTSSKKGFARVREIAGLPDLRFHDLRHTHATRLVSKHLPLSEVGRVLGHTQANTTYRYVNANAETARRAAAVLDEFNSDGCLSGLTTTIQ
ncbi:MAG TPA: site-specific integrase, partial [Blastocatellia bacterium]|nr:site-specific integrase [Blastocatellia bacterium]